MTSQLSQEGIAVDSVFSSRNFNAKTTFHPPKKGSQMGVRPNKFVRIK